MKISVITVTYNSGKTIASTMESVLSQTYKDIEYIIVDGNSDDDTMNIVKQYEPRFNGKMRYISEKDKGIYDAMNKGILISTGEVVGILNSDDFYTSGNVLEEVAKNISGVDAVYGDVHFVSSDNLGKCVRYYSSRIFRPWILRFGIMPAHPTFYCRRELYEKYGVYSLEYRIASDYDMMVRLFHKEKISYRYIPLDFVTMRMCGVSTRNTKNRLILTKEDVQACRKYGLRTNILFVSMKYFIKILELRF
ncbi:MAG: glycosyltransferase [Bacteroidaceae bacterium]|nr:glycosyltransferase [Bacteroidaceae bacterium]